MGVAIGSADGGRETNKLPVGGKKSIISGPSLKEGSSCSLKLVSGSSSRSMESASDHIPQLEARSFVEESCKTKPVITNFHADDIKPACRAFRLALQDYVDGKNKENYKKDTGNKSEKHGAYFRAYCQDPQLKPYLYIDNNDKVSAGLPNSLNDAVSVMNKLLKGHMKSSKSGMFKALTRPILEKGNILSSYFRIKSGKVALQKKLPDSAVCVEQDLLHSKKPQAERVQIKTPADEKNTEQAQDDNIQPLFVRRLSEREQQQLSIALSSIFDGYLSQKEPAVKAKHQSRLLTVLSDPKSTPMLRKHLSLNGDKWQLNVPNTAADLKDVLHELLSHFRGYDSRVALKTSSLVDNIQAAIQDKTNPLNGVLVWRKSSHSILVRADEYAQKVAAETEADLQAQEKAIQDALIRKEIIAVKKEIREFQAIMPKLYERVFLARKLHKIAEHHWPDAHPFAKSFVSINMTSMPALKSFEHGEHLSGLKKQLHELKEKDRAFRGEIELRMEQLPTSSDIPGGDRQLKDGMTTFDVFVRDKTSISL